MDAFLEGYAWSDGAASSFADLQNILKANNVPFTANPRMVRGLDYYSRTVFEFITDQLGAQGTVCGGGRYNGLIEELGGPPTPAIGWAMGLERLAKLMTAPVPEPLDAYIVTDQHALAFQLASALRTKGQRVEVDLSSRNFGKQMQTANKRGAQVVYTLGDQERASGSIPCKNFASGETMAVSLSELLGNE
jgi:histidyl-tRNA synthetase